MSYQNATNYCNGLKSEILLKLSDPTFFEDNRYPTVDNEISDERTKSSKQYFTSIFYQEIFNFDLLNSEKPG